MGLLQTSCFYAQLAAEDERFCFERMRMRTQEPMGFARHREHFFESVPGDGVVELLPP